MVSVPEATSSSIGRRLAMRIGFASPLTVAKLVPWLDVEPGATLPVGLGATGTTDLLVALLEAGHSVAAVTLDRTLTSPVTLRGDRLTLHIGPYRARHRARDYFRQERRFVREAMLVERPDVISAQWTYEFALGSLETGLPTVVHLQDWAPTVLRLFGLKVAPYYTVRLAMHIQALLQADALIANSPDIAHKAARWCHRPVPVQPNGFPNEMFALSDRRAPNSEQPVILAANNGFNRLKNTAKLIKAFDLVRREIPGAQLHLAGSDHGIDGPAEKWATERRLEHQVTFIGPLQQQELLGRMREADLFVHPSRSESFGNVLVEAMAQGTPTIGGRRSGAVPWVLDEGRAGLLTDIQRPDVLAEAMLSILRDPDRWVHFSKSGFRISKQRFSVDVVARQHADLLTSHLANASSR